MKKKIAIIGMGESGRRHLSELRRSDYFELIALCDKVVTDEFGRFEIFGNLDEMFNTKKPEAVVIATPSNTHKELILKCMRYVKNIFVEAPFTNSLAETREINYAAKTNSLCLGIGYNDRFNPVVISLLKELKKEEKILSMNFINATNKRENFDIISQFMIKNLDLIRFISSSEVINFDMKKILFKDSRNSAIACATLKTKSEILINLMVNAFYPIRKHTIEICTPTGVYFADLVNLILYKITQSGRINLKVDREDFSIRHEHRCFYDICENKVSGGELATTDDAVKAREIIGQL